MSGYHLQCSFTKLSIRGEQRACIVDFNFIFIFCWMHAWLSRKHFSPNGFSGSLVMFMDIQMTLGMYFILVLYFCLMVFGYRFLVYFKDCIDQEAGTEYYYLYPRSKSSRWMPSIVIVDNNHNIIEVSVLILSEIFPICAFLSLALLGACRLYTDFFFQLSELKSWKGIFFLSWWFQPSWILLGKITWYKKQPLCQLVQYSNWCY